MSVNAASVPVSASILPRLSNRMWTFCYLAIVYLTIVYAIASVHALDLPPSNDAPTPIPVPSHQWSRYFTAPSHTRLPLIRGAVATLGEKASDLETVLKVVNRRHGVHSRTLVASSPFDAASIPVPLPAVRKRVRSRPSHRPRRTNSTSERRSRLHTMSSIVANGSPLIGCASLDFSIPVLLGMSGSTVFQLLFDTGSSTLAVAGSSCTTCTSAGVSPLYAATGTTVGTTSSSYGDGSGWSGKIYTDTVTVAGTTSSVGITPAVSMRLASMTKQTNSFFSAGTCTNSNSASAPWQGIIGFAYESLAMTNTDSFPYKLIQQTASTTSPYANQFYVEMCVNDGALWFSGMSLASYSGQFNYVPISVQSYYQVAVSSVSVGSSVVGSNLGSSESIVDSGTSMWSLPTSTYNAAIAKINTNTQFKSWFGTSFWSAESCVSTPSGQTITTMNAALPTLSITFGNGVVASLPAIGSYIIPCDSTMTTWQYGIDDSGDTSMTMGWSFMNVFVVHHDLANAKIGFAVATGCSPLYTATGSGATISGNPSGPVGTGVGGSSGSTTTATFAVATSASSIYVSGSTSTVTLTPSAAATATVTVTLTCSGAVTSTQQNSLATGSSSTVTFTVTSSSSTGTIQCGFSLSGTGASQFAVPSSVAFSVIARSTTGGSSSTTGGSAWSSSAGSGSTTLSSSSSGGDGGDYGDMSSTGAAPNDVVIPTTFPLLCTNLVYPSLPSASNLYDIAANVASDIALATGVSASRILVVAAINVDTETTQVKFTLADPLVTSQSATADVAKGFIDSLSGSDNPFADNGSLYPVLQYATVGETTVCSSQSELTSLPLVQFGLSYSIDSLPGGDVVSFANQLRTSVAAACQTPAGRLVVNSVVAGSIQATFVVSDARLNASDISASTAVDNFSRHIASVAGLQSSSSILSQAVVNSTRVSNVGAAIAAANGQGTTPTTDDSSSSSDNTRTILIAVVAAAGVVFLIAFIWVSYACCCKKRADESRSVEGGDSSPVSAKIQPHQNRDGNQRSASPPQQRNTKSQAKMGFSGVTPQAPSQQPARPASDYGEQNYYAEQNYSTRQSRSHQLAPTVSQSNVQVLVPPPVVMHVDQTSYQTSYHHQSAPLRNPQSQSYPVRSAAGGSNTHMQMAQANPAAASPRTFRINFDRAQRGEGRA